MKFIEGTLELPTHPMRVKAEEGYDYYEIVGQDWKRHDQALASTRAQRQEVEVDPETKKVKTSVDTAMAAQFRVNVLASCIRRMNKPEGWNSDDDTALTSGNSVADKAWAKLSPGEFLTAAELSGWPKTLVDECLKVADRLNGEDKETVGNDSARGTKDGPPSQEN